MKKYKEMKNDSSIQYDIIIDNVKETENDVCINV